MHKYTQLKYAKGDGSLLFLLTHALEGYGKASMEPLLPVSLVANFFCNVHNYYVMYVEQALTGMTAVD